MGAHRTLLVLRTSHLVLRTPLEFERALVALTLLVERELDRELHLPTRLHLGGSQAGHPVGRRLALFRFDQGCRIASGLLAHRGHRC